MKCTIPEISWHNRDPVLSLDLQPNLKNDYYRLATGGTDSHVLIWHLRILESGATSVEPVSDLTRHQRAVNVVRWSPTGQYLASGDDDANIIVWQQKADELSIMLDGETNDKEKWSVFKVLRGHKEDVYDICWSPNSMKLISGSVDNTAIIWDLTKGNNDNILKDHKGFVQGVCWDPRGQYIATLCSDRTCRVFNDTGKQVKSRISKGSLALPESHPLYGQIMRYYHDDTLKSFFRRLTFSPDGNLLITPAGCLDSGQQNKPLYTTYVYVTNSFSQPAAILPSPGQYTIAVKCCPTLFELRTDGPDPAVLLPYRMVIAVATRSSVILYDTQQLSPFAVISNIHYTRLTDLSWSQDGRILAISSTDGFCSLVTFECNELGTEYTKEDSDEENLEQTVCEENLDTSILVEDKPEEKREKKPSFLKQWTLKKSHKNESKNLMEKNIIEPQKEIETIVIDDKVCETPPKKLPNKNVSVSSPHSSAGVKPIAVRRNPRPAQMDITKFLKSPKESVLKKSIPIVEPNDTKIYLTSTKTTPKMSISAEKTPNLSQKNKLDVQTKPILVSEDSVAQDAWSSSENMEVDKKEAINNDLIVIEDSQEMILVLEDTYGGNVNNDTQNNVENKIKVNDTDKTIKETCEPADKTTDISINNKDTENKEVNNKLEDVHMECESSKINLEVKNKINDLQIQPASPRIAAISKESTSQRKKVPFITLSSPKSKKKEDK